jgi:hypothetical protein
LLEFEIREPHRRVTRRIKIVSKGALLLFPTYSKIAFLSSPRPRFLSIFKQFFKIVLLRFSHDVWNIRYSTIMARQGILRDSYHQKKICFHRSFLHS